MNNFVVLFILITDIITYATANQDSEYIKYSETQKYSWIGILKVKLERMESVTGIVLIAEGIALANANEISRIDGKVIRKLAKATFLVTDFPRNCSVTKYLVHPEYERDTLNTIALVYLECENKYTENDDSYYQIIKRIIIPVKPVNWPKSNIFWKQIYVVGFTDQHYDLEHFIYRMVLMNRETCREFYKREELDFKHLWPRHFLCSKGAEINNVCTFDAGMALVANYKGTVTLIGLSISGPGCSLPSRYIELFPYIPWIKSQIETIKLNFTRRSGTTRNQDVKPIDPSSNIVSDYHFVEDDFYVTKINDTTIVMEAAYANIKEYHGDCLNNFGVLIYKEADIIRTRGFNTGVYALSLYDLFYNKITCVMVTLKCTKRSLSKFWYEKGFQKDDLSDIIKVIPVPKRGQPIPSKILLLTDLYHRYDKIMTANIYFKFEFRNEVTINIDFFGTLHPTSDNTTTITSTTSTS